MNKRLTILLFISALFMSCQSPQISDYPNGWTKIVPDGETQCAHGDPYAFWVRRGTEDKLIIFFQGGGVCWNGASCSFGSPFYNHNVECEGNCPNLQNGIFDFENHTNPFLSYNFVVIPYCTGDFHWGNKTKSYLSGRFFIHHQGFVNAQAVLEWVYIQFPEPESILVAGSSAGSIGAILHASYIIEAYPNSTVSVLGDSGAIFPPNFDFDSNFDALQNFPAWVWDPEMSPENSGASSPGFNLAQFYIATARKYHDHQFALLNYARDAKQLQIYKDIEMLSSVPDTLITDNLEYIHENAPNNLKTFTTQGSDHTILARDSFFDIPCLSNWVFMLAKGEVIPNVEIDYGD